jgi:hypothetical protein
LSINKSDVASYAPVGQAFFIKGNINGEYINFTKAMQIHKNDVLLKSATTPHPQIQLVTTINNAAYATKIRFVDGTTNGLDVGYDAGLFRADPNFALYTRLVEDNGVNFQLQCLPPTGYDKLVIQVGIDSKAGGEIVFSVQTVQLDPSCKVILEDKLTNTFTDLSKDSYKVTLEANTSVIDRFFLQTSDIISGLEDQELSAGKLSAYAIGNVELRVIGEVSDKAVATMYNARGQVVLTKKLSAGSLNIIGLPNLSSGLYLLNINDKGTTQTIKVMVRK